MATTPRNTEDLVRSYYSTVDAGDPEATAALFATDATYHRPGYDPLVGPAIAEFYRTERVIESGEHTVTEVLVDGLRASSRGVFNGVLKDGRAAEEGFADFWEFNEDGTIANRTSYFYRAAV
ncbi:MULTISPECIES: nuclear transport factor 2 family protein [Auritidibacter]|uniref:nuclear transport factor 2 family protein n=1 Tax=Auritidibacter TaxID=1160973 RepID=UPI000D73F07E|nr:MULTISPECIES: nuclear transport factor 2 family protein [Auritidibacter]AXR74551.1 nuclear transport factor 2 family protein [Auritidibacter sp. NML130574]PXA80618.1 ketosteroid isomerase [Auritidibacter sp. NML120636]WGH85682.1 nuclear transport factor 2 family protein [Auritidibacter ignavus]WGH87970.1 nuclear transport factor 2 family protein [Auritidibacter ignavus]